MNFSISIQFVHPELFWFLCIDFVKTMKKQHHPYNIQFFIRMVVFPIRSEVALNP